MVLYKTLWNIYVASFDLIIMLHQGFFNSHIASHNQSLEINNSWLIFKTWILWGLLLNPPDTVLIKQSI